MVLENLSSNNAQQPLASRRRVTNNLRQQGDRFIPARNTMDLGVSTFELEKDTPSCSGPMTWEHETNASPAKEEYKKRLASDLFNAEPCNNKVLAIGSSPKSPEKKSTSDDSLRMLYTLNRSKLKRASMSAGRHIPQSPERILDAPELLDDYYLNLLDWSSSNVLGVALGDAVYLWNASSGAITPLMQTQAAGAGGAAGVVTAIGWEPRDANLMAIGTSECEVQIWDTTRCKLVRTMGGHCGRVGVLAWHSAHALSSGSRDASIAHWDLRAPNTAVARIDGHAQEVCGLKWALNSTQLASGGNDNLLNVWDERRLGSASPVFSTCAHQAAVKALAWCPWQRNLLASGGGTADRMIRFWDLHTAVCVNAMDTHSQVCALQWSPHNKELVSSHGYSHNQLILWKYPSMVKLAELTGHTSRVLHMAQSPDGTTIVSAAADETLRFWKILGGDASAQRRSGESVLARSAWGIGTHVVR